MITWLSAWLKEIILAVMLAAFVDMLLPSSSFQRYVKTVLSLFILLVILQPIANLLHTGRDTAPDLLAAAANAGKQAGQADGMKSLQSILREAENWRTDDRKKTERLLAAQIESELVHALPEETPVRLYEVDLDMTYDNNGTPQIQKMRVVLDSIDETIDSARAGSSGPGVTRSGIRPVEPVHIEIRLGGREAGMEDAGLAENMENAKQRIYELLTREWMLKKNQVEILYKSELQKAR
jgi:stage III sporulation protein AF